MEIAIPARPADGADAADVHRAETWGGIDPARARWVVYTIPLGIAAALNDRTGGFAAPLRVHGTLEVSHRGLSLAEGAFLHLDGGRVEAGKGSRPSELRGTIFVGDGGGTVASVGRRTLTVDGAVQGAGRLTFALEKTRRGETDAQAAIAADFSAFHGDVAFVGAPAGPRAPPLTAEFLSPSWGGGTLSLSDGRVLVKAPPAGFAAEGALALPLSVDHELAGLDLGGALHRVGRLFAGDLAVEAGAHDAASTVNFTRVPCAGGATADLSRVLRGAESAALVVGSSGGEETCAAREAAPSPEHYFAGGGVTEDTLPASSPFDHGLSVFLDGRWALVPRGLWLPCNTENFRKVPVVFYPTAEAPAARAGLADLSGMLDDVPSTVLQVCMEEPTDDAKGNKGHRMVFVERSSLAAGDLQWMLEAVAEGIAPIDLPLGKAGERLSHLAYIFGAYTQRLKALERRMAILSALQRAAARLDAPSIADAAQSAATVAADHMLSLAQQVVRAWRNDSTVFSGKFARPAPHEVAAYANFYAPTIAAQRLYEAGRRLEEADALLEACVAFGAPLLSSVPAEGDESCASASAAPSASTGAGEDEGEDEEEEDGDEGAGAALEACYESDDEAWQEKLTSSCRSADEDVSFEAVRQTTFNSQSCAWRFLANLAEALSWKAARLAGEGRALPAAEAEALGAAQRALRLLVRRFTEVAESFPAGEGRSMLFWPYQPNDKGPNRTVRRRAGSEHWSRNARCAASAFQQPSLLLRGKRVFKNVDDFAHSKATITGLAHLWFAAREAEARTGSGDCVYGMDDGIAAKIALSLRKHFLDGGGHLMSPAQRELLSGEAEAVREGLTAEDVFEAWGRLHETRGKMHFLVKEAMLFAAAAGRSGASDLMAVAWRCGGRAHGKHLDYGILARLHYVE